MDAEERALDAWLRDADGDLARVLAADVDIDGALEQIKNAALILTPVPEGSEPRTGDDLTDTTIGQGEELPGQLAQQQPASMSLLPSPTLGRPSVDKSVGAAMILAFLFGPLGLFYTSIIGGLVLSLLLVVSVAMFGVFGLCALVIIWPTSIVWSMLSASYRHAIFETWRTLEMGPGYGGIYERRRHRST